MATHYYSEDELRTIENIKMGIENCLFQVPQMIVEAMQKFFGDAKLTLCEETPKEGTFTIHCESDKWSASKYHRIFVFTYAQHSQKEYKVIEVQEIK